MHTYFSAVCIKPYPAKLIYLYFQPYEGVPCYRNPQPQVVEKYSYLFNLKRNIYLNHDTLLYRV